MQTLEIEEQKVTQTEVDEALRELNRIHLNVRQDLILSGFRHVANKCPIAYAMEAAGLEDPRVGMIGCTWRDDDATDGRAGYLFPANVASWIRRYDNLGIESVGPIEFDIFADNDYMRKYAHADNDYIASL